MPIEFACRNVLWPMPIGFSCRNALWPMPIGFSFRPFILFLFSLVAGVYRTYTYDDEMAEALQKWSGALDAILDGESLDDYMERLKNKQPDNVVQLPVSA